MLLLGIDTSCDDTSVAVVRDGREVLVSLLSSQVDVHAAYDGVVPELAARKHLEALFPLLDTALTKANVALDDIDAIAVTNRPGLIGSLLVGVGAAKGLAYAHALPLIPVDHLAAHIYSVHLTHDVPFPYVALVVSGGHTVIAKVTAHNEYTVFGTTLDDAVGEAYDKVAKHLGLGYPGGPVIDRLAQKGDATAINYPLPMLAEKDRYHFSYSGLKTAVIYQTERLLKEGACATHENIAASFQRRAIEVIYRKAVRFAEDKGIPRVTLSGGVAANSALRTTFAESEEITAFLPERKYTSDNAAMVAGLAYHIAHANPSFMETPKTRDAFIERVNIDCASRVVAKIERGRS